MLICSKKADLWLSGEGWWGQVKGWIPTWPERSLGAGGYFHGGEAVTDAHICQTYRTGHFQSVHFTACMICVKKSTLSLPFLLVKIKWNEMKWKMGVIEKHLQERCESPKTGFPHPLVICMSPFPLWHVCFLAERRGWNARCLGKVH